MNQPIEGIVGGMGASLDGPVLGGGGEPQPSLGLEIGVLNDRVGFRIKDPAKSDQEDPGITLMFTLQEVYGIIGALEGAVAHVRQQIGR